EAEPLPGTHSGFLHELPLRSDDRRLVRLELARRQLPKPPVCNVAVLLQQANTVLAIDGNRRCTTRMVNDFERCQVTVRQSHLVRGKRDDPAAEVHAAFLWLHT